MTIGGRIVKSEIDEVVISVHPKGDDKHIVDPLCSARVGVHRMRQRETEAVARGADVETLMSDLQVHPTSCLPWQLHTHHHILAACRACSLATHL